MTGSRPSSACLEEVMPPPILLLRPHSSCASVCCPLQGLLVPLFAGCLLLCSYCRLPLLAHGMFLLQPLLPSPQRLLPEQWCRLGRLPP